MCIFTKSVKGLSHDITFCNTTYCVKFGKIIKVIPAKDIY